MNGPHFAAQTHAPARPAARPPARPADRPKAEAPGLLVLTYLRLHWMMIAFCGTFLGAGLAYAAWSLLPSKYESYALLQVASSPPAIAAPTDPSRGKTDFVTYLKTNALLIKSDFVLNSALSDTKHRIGELPTLKEQKDPIKYLDEKLVVNYSDGNEVIRISLEGDRPDDVRKIVDAVKDAYYREVVEKELNQKAALKLKVEQAKTTLETLLKAKVLPVAPNKLPDTVVQASTPGAPPTLPGGAPDVGQAGAVVPVQPGPIGLAVGDSELVKRARFPLLITEVARLNTELRQYPLVIQERQAEIDGLKKEMEKLRHGTPSADAVAAAEKDPEYLMKLAEAQRIRDEYNFLAKTVNNPNAEYVQRFKRDAEKAEADAARIKGEKATALETDRRQKQVAVLARMMETAEKAVKQFQSREKASQKALEDAQKELAQMPPELKKEEKKGPRVDPLGTEIDTTDGIYALVTAQLIRLEMDLQSPPRVRKLQEASSPSQKDSKKQLLGTIAGGLLGFALLGLGAVAYETRVRKVTSLGELRASGPTPVVGVIPWTPDGTVARDPVKRADVNEAIDKLRSYVSQTWLSRGATTIAVTSPLGDEGKAFAAFGLASSLAQAGYKTLVIDFDLRNPSLHPFAGVPNTLGVCELLRGEADPRQAVLALPNGLNILPAGRWSDEARQAAVGGRFETMLARLREAFDCVVLHGHALLTVAESIEVVRRADVVLLCTLYRETRLPLLKRATERLAAMEVPNSGVVYLGATPNEALC